MTKLFLSPHDDDQILFGCFTLIRERPLTLIVTDSWVQFNRGENITSEMRTKETEEAMKILGLPFVRLNVRDDAFDVDILKYKLSQFIGFDEVLSPDPEQHGNLQHDLVGMIATEIWGDKCKHYTTYTKVAPHTKGKIEIVPTIEEVELKNKALDCYKTQIGNCNKIYFKENRGRSEWLI